VADPNDEHDESIVVDLVHDAVVAHADSVQVVRAGELLDALGPNYSYLPFFTTPW